MQFQQLQRANTVQPKQVEKVKLDSDFSQVAQFPSIEIIK
jgi:hypothetical protein